MTPARSALPSSAARRDINTTLRADVQPRAGNYLSVFVCFLVFFLF